MLLLLVVAAAAYTALWWYPTRAAETLLDDPSASFAPASEAYQEAVDAFPSEPAEETLVAQTTAALATAEDARGVLAEAQAEIEAREPIGLPVIENRGPLPLANRMRQRMLDFYIGGLELVADTEGISRYLTEMTPLFDHLDEVGRALEDTRTTQEADRAVEEASPVADQLLADIEAVTPPPELSGAHEAVVAVAARVQADLGELGQVGGRGAGPIIASLAQQIRRQLETLRETILGAPAEALEEGGLGARIEHLEELQGRVAGGLRRLRDQFGVPVTVPET